MSVLLFIVILSFLVIAHEWGHFYSARKFGIGVEEFGVGFPPRAWSKVVNGIRYSINWLPLGGFVKIKGEDGQHAEDADSFINQKAWKRFIVLVAGVVMNFLVAAILLGVGFIFGLPQDSTGVDPSLVSDKKVQILSVVDGYPAQLAGLKSGDTLISFNNTPITSVESVVTTAQPLENQEVLLVYKRNNEVITTPVTVKKITETGKPGIGVALLESGIVTYPWYRAIPQGFITAGEMTKDIAVGFVSLIKNLATGNKVGGVAGPVGIAVMTGEVASLGWAHLLSFTAMLSLNLAVLNMIPFPALDGGRVLFIIIEKLTGRKVNRSIEGVVHAMGFLLLMLLIIVVTFKDVVRLFVK